MLYTCLLNTSANGWAKSNNVWPTARNSQMHKPVLPESLQAQNQGHNLKYFCSFWMNIFRRRLWILQKTSRWKNVDIFQWEWVYVLNSGNYCKSKEMFFFPFSNYVNRKKAALHVRLLILLDYVVMLHCYNLFPCWCLARL